jgi:hypothetical protein
MCDFLDIDVDSFCKFLQTKKNTKPLKKLAKLEKSVWIERISYVMSETTIVLNEYPDCSTDPLITDKDMLRVLMGDLWVMYYGGSAGSQRILWEGLDRYRHHSQIIRLREQELMDTVKRRFIGITAEKKVVSLASHGAASMSTRASFNNFKH